MRAISRFSTQYPKTILFLVFVITAVSIYQIYSKAYVETDMTKFVPTDLQSVKANDYYRKNFNYKESLIIGLEAKNGRIMEPDILRANESIVRDIKSLKKRKTIKSKITGKTEIIALPIGIDGENISSISGLEDGILDRETGAVITGSVIAKLKKEAGIPYTKENAELLPESDEDLKKIIPRLEQYILNDRLFKGNILSEDGKATSIVVPMVNKWQYMQLYTQRELTAAMDPDALRARFQGKTSVFPFDVFGKTIDNVIYDDTFISKHSAKVAKKLKEYLEKELKPSFENHPNLKELMSGNITPEKYNEIIRTTQDKNFFMNPDLATWDSYTIKLYEFMLEVIDPLSRENLQFQLPDVYGIYNFLYVYERIQKILEKHQNVGIKTYVAGHPVVSAVISQVIKKDMSVLMPIGFFLILVTLAISFRNVMGVVIPLTTVVLSVIWSLGLFVSTGTPITAATSMVPIILLAVGSAYGIHFLNRYQEDAKDSSDRRLVLRRTIEGVGAAIIMAGLTTFAGFISLSSSSVLTVRHFSLATAFGILVALLLTLTLTPAILCYWKSPHKTMKESQGIHQTARFDTILSRWSKWLLHSPKKILVIFVILSIFNLILMQNLRFEGSIMEGFKKDTQIRMSDDFINRFLSGTGEISLLFKFRDNVNLDNSWVRSELRTRSLDFNRSWKLLIQKDATLEQSRINEVEQRIVRFSENPEKDGNELATSIALFNDILNEEYMVEIDQEKTVSAQTPKSEINALSSNEGAEVGADESGLGGLADLAETKENVLSNETSGPFAAYSSGQVNGIKKINERLGLAESAWKETGKTILALRDFKSTADGKKMIQRWNLLQDLFAADIKQPYVLRKLESIREALINVNEPRIMINGVTVRPTGSVFGPVDMIRKTYSVFYHDENPAFQKIPDVEKDNLGDPTLTDRSVIGVVLNQVQNASRDRFESMISPNRKEFQFSVMLRSSLTSHAAPYLNEVKNILSREFPKDDPYIASVSVGGHLPVIMEMSYIVSKSQVSSIAQAMLFVLIITFFIFRSIRGGLYSLIPLVFTLLANFGMMIALGWTINTATVMVASISIGIGIDYTIHFLERFKSHLRTGDDFHDAYFNTIRSVGKAILINAVSVSAGFLLLLTSDIGGNRSLGLLMAGSMGFSSLAALTLLPALIFVTKPKFLANIVDRAQTNIWN